MPAPVHDAPEADAPEALPAPPIRAGKAGTLAAAGALGAACVYTALVNPNTSGAYPQCPLRLVTGVDCALCGGLRATHALLGGDLIEAAGRNLLLVLLAPLAVYAGAQWMLAPWGVRLPRLPVRPWMGIALLAVAAVYSVVRNLSWGPGPWLHSDT